MTQDTGYTEYRTLPKHTRYLFLQSQDEGCDELTSAQMMATVSNVVAAKLDGKGLIRTIAADTNLVRIRVDDKPHTAATEIGTPKPEHVGNRIALALRVFRCYTARLIKIPRTPKPSIPSPIPARS